MNHRDPLSAAYPATAKRLAHSQQRRRWVAVALAAGLAVLVAIVVLTMR